SEGNSARVTRALLDVVEGDLHHQLGTDVDRVGVTRDLELEQSSGLPGEHRIGQSFERLAEHHEAPMLGITSPEMQIAERSATPSVPPLRRQHNQIQGAGPLDLQPRTPSMAGGIQTPAGFGHDAFMARAY